MMADNIEHVISYWVIFQKFHSPALGAFAVVSHWAPYLLFAAYTGGLADRFDIRRLIQIGMLLFMGVSIGWGVMFATDSTQQWKAEALLVVHGLAGVIWMPASQVLIHRIVGAELVPSAVRLNATGRYLAFLVGPAIGGVLLLAFGPVNGIFLNALIYAPLFVWLIKAPYGPDRAGAIAAARNPGIQRYLVDPEGGAEQPSPVVDDRVGRRLRFFYRQCLSGANAGIRARFGARACGGFLVQQLTGSGCGGRPHRRE